MNGVDEVDSVDIPFGMIVIVSRLLYDSFRNFLPEFPLATGKLCAQRQTGFLFGQVRFLVCGHVRELVFGENYYMHSAIHIFNIALICTRLTNRHLA